MPYLERLLEQQYRCPTGLVGRFVGEKMVRQHEPEVQWTISLLDLATTDQVLEIGCGAGRALELAASHVSAGQVFGIDYSATMAQLSQWRKVKANIGGQLQVIQADVTNLPFAAVQFDTIWSIHTLYFWPDQAQALAELARVLRPGGLLVLTISPGKVGDHEKSAILTMVEEQLLPTMQQFGFTTSLKHGPNSRQFRTMGILGQKEGSEDGRRRNAGK